MFQVTFYTFSKKRNSTAAPTGTGSPYNCTAKAPLSVTAPVITLKLAEGAAANPSAWNYAHITAFGRYYYVSGWTNDGPLWTAYLRVDVLASFKTSIGSQTCYVYRSSYSYDLRVPDMLYPTTTRLRKLNISLPKVWTVGGGNTHNFASYYYVVQVIGQSGTETYAMTPDNFVRLLKYLYSDDYYDAVLGVFGATEYPEAKVAINPMQFISQVKLFYGSVLPSAQWALNYDATVTSVKVGPATVAPTAFTACHLSGISLSLEDINTDTGDFVHPQADERGDWLNFAPFTNYELFYPPFGLIELDPASIAGHDTLRVRLSIDNRTLTAMLEVRVLDAATPNKIRTIVRMVSDVGVDIPVSAIVQPGTSQMQILRNTIGGIAQTVTGLATGNPASAVTGLFGAVDAGVGAAVQGQVPHLSSMGHYGTGATLDGTPCLYVTQWYLSDDDLPDKGRPLCQIKTLSAIPGFIIADSDHVAIACTDPELAEIKSAIRGGFYYE